MKGTTEDERVGWHQQYNGHEFEQTPGIVDREAWHAAVHGVAKKEINRIFFLILKYMFYL